METLLINRTKAIFKESILLKEKLLEGELLEKLSEMAIAAVESFTEGGKLLICGNGGSAADAQHLAAELLVRLRPHVNREAIPAIALAMDTSSLTACGNDYNYECFYERMTKALGKPGDILLGITTSGRSMNITRALKAARELKLKTFRFLGGDGGHSLQECDISFVVPSKETGRIQEAHITAGHALMELIEELMLIDGEVQMMKNDKKCITTKALISEI